MEITSNSLAWGPLRAIFSIAPSESTEKVAKDEQWRSPIGR
ncbi:MULTISPECIES: hypothetical protein [unclassified Microcoleus]|nr:MULTISPECIES: hypothetical protein [unclassified Microcoleus]